MCCNFYNGYQGWGFLSHKMAEDNSKFKRVVATLSQGWSAPDYQSFDWGVTAFAVGIAVYFALPFEPSLVWILMIISALGGLAWLMGRFAQRLYPVVFIVFLMALGIGRSVWHTDAAAQPPLPDYERSYTVTGWIEAIEKSGTGFRWRLRVSEVSGLEPGKTPMRVRVKAKTEGFDAGDGITIRAVLKAPPGPVVPNGYDPARRAYFEQIGGYGFAIGAPSPASVAAKSAPEKWKRGLVRFRYSLAARIRKKAPPETAGLQAALLTGVRSYIPQEQTDTLRAAGLAHVLAISGLHMGLLAGGSYFLATLGLAMIAPLSRRYDVRKPAALIGALAATGYLVLSGASVATQRAFIMAIIVFLAVMLDRRAFSMRSVAVAALITLMLHPESLISVGFQMSFAAVAALVVVYREWSDKRGYVPRIGILQKVWSNLSTLTVTSLVAGTATSGFAVLHFNRIARYSLIGNIFAMPIFTFIVMPAALMALIMMPLGLEGLPLAIMGRGLSLLLKVAGWVAALNGAIWHVPAAPAWVIGIFGGAFVLAALGQGARRYLGFAIAALCFVIWSQTPRPDMRISDTGQAAFWDEPNGYILYVGGKRSDRYGREQFMQRAGQPGSDMLSYQDTLALCDALACRFVVKGQQVSVVSHPSAVPEECAASGVVVLTVREAGPVARRGCGAELLDARVFRKSGALDIYIEEERVRIEPSNTKARRQRPWGR